jgi:hypothetical protein
MREHSDVALWILRIWRHEQYRPSGPDDADAPPDSTDCFPSLILIEMRHYEDGDLELLSELSQGGKRPSNILIPPTIDATR